MCYKPAHAYHVRATQCKDCRKITGRQSYSQNKLKINYQNKSRSLFIQKSVYDIIGNQCAYCSETEYEFLTVDHIFNDRRRERKYGSSGWKLDILNGKSDLSRYQTLCRNCNESRQRKNPTQLVKERIKTGILKNCFTCKQLLDKCYFNNNCVRITSSGPKLDLRSSCCFCTNNKNFQKVLDCYTNMGGMCVCCHETDTYKLNIDHINNDGKHRRKTDGSGWRTCGKLLNGKLDPSDFQILCSNCNYSKMVHKGQCIHELKGLNGL